MQEVTCEHCGEVFQRKPSAIARSAHQYCSKACANRANARRGVEHPRWNRRELECPVCGTRFERLPCHTGKKWSTCSPECDVAYRRTLTGAARYNWGGLKLMACEVCGAEKIVQSPSRQRTFRACSRSCATILGIRSWPRVSSLETAMAEAFERAALEPVAQYAVDRATADFAFPDARLIVECDGSYWHSLPDVRRRDQRRDGWLRSRGWRVLRLPEDDIRADADACVDRVRRWLAHAPASAGSRTETDGETTGLSESVQRGCIASTEAA